MASILSVLRSIKDKLTKSAGRSHDLPGKANDKENGIFFDSVNQDKVGVKVKKKIIKGQKKFLADLWNFITMFMEGLYWSERSGKGLLKMPPSATNYKQTIYTTKRSRIDKTQSVILSHDLARSKVSGEYYKPAQNIIDKQVTAQKIQEQQKAQDTKIEHQHQEQHVQTEQRLTYINNRIRAMGIDPRTSISDAIAASSTQKAFQRSTFLELKRRQMMLENTNER